MAIDYDELERRVVEKMEKNLPPAGDDVAANLVDFIHKEAVYSAIHVLVEYEKMKQEAQQ